MKITIFSDSHGKHGYIDTDLFKDADTIIFCGDFSPGKGYLSHDLENFATWFSTIPAKYKLFIAGNHDHFMEDSTNDEIERIISKYPALIYLNDSGITLDGIKFWGSPVQLFFHAWAFNRMSGTDIGKHWDMIPDSTDVLIVHGPPNGILDKLVRPNFDGNYHPGCPQLRRHIFDRLKPQVVCFGHIHEGYGTRIDENITFVNASVLNEHYELVNAPISLIVDPR